MQLGNPLIQCALYWRKPDFLCVLTRLFQSQTKKKSTKIEDIGGKVTRRCNNCKSPRQWCCLPIWGKLVKFNALLVLRCRFRSDRTGTVKRGDGGSGEEKLHCQTRLPVPPDWTENNKVQQEELNQRLFVKELRSPPGPSCSDLRKETAFYPPAGRLYF